MNNDTFDEEAVLARFKAAAAKSKPVPVRCQKCERYFPDGKHDDKECRAYVWEHSLCPPEFRGFDIEKIPARIAYEAALKWEYGKNGLFMFGPSRSGKTRTAYEICRREYVNRGKIPKILTGSLFASKCAAASMDRGDEYYTDRARHLSGPELMERLSEWTLLVLDDIDKAKYTEFVETQLFEIIAHRIAWQRPTIITTQFDGDAFAAKFTDAGRGKTIIERIAASFMVVAF